MTRRDLSSREKVRWLTATAVVVGVGVGVIVVILAGCSTREGGTGAPAHASDSPSSTPAASGDGYSYMGGGMMGRGNQRSSSANVIAVTLMDWSISASRTSVKAGTIEFDAFHLMMDMHNLSGGGRTHDLSVAKVNADGSYEQLGKVTDIGLGQGKTVKLNLSPGNYELECNVVEEVNGTMVSHYKKGMHLRFVVTG